MIIKRNQTEIEVSKGILKVAIMARDSTYASVLLIRLYPNPVSVTPKLIFITFDVSSCQLKQSQMTS